MQWSRLIIIMILSVWSVSMIASDDTNWLIDADLSILPTFDIEGRGLCLSVAPVKERSWGIESYVFTGDADTFGANALDWYRIQHRDDYIYLYGREVRGEWGLVRLVQGNAWGESSCKADIDWYQPMPVRASTVRHVDVTYQFNQSTLLTQDNSWAMVALNLWFNHAQFAKRLVIDLVFYHDCNIAGCTLRHFEDDFAFHYMHPIADLTTTDIPSIISSALQTTYLNECRTQVCLSRLPSVDPMLEQFDFLIELHNAEVAVTVSSLAVYTSDED